MQVQRTSSINTSQIQTEQNFLQASTSHSVSPSIPVNKKRKECNTDITDTRSDTTSSGSLMSFVVRTSKPAKNEIDKQIARALYATNSSFICLEQSEVKKAIALLRPGYVPPSRNDVSGRLLDQIYTEERSKCFKGLSRSNVCLSLDGWSNVHNEPIVCATVTAENGSSFLFDTVDTIGHPHTSYYLTEIAATLINKLKTEYDCTVSSFVTDNAANMSAMRNEIKVSDKFNVIAYGCATHILNLLCKDFEIVDIKQHVFQIVKYFRNNHFASATYAKEGGKKLVIPSDVRWNSLADCLQVFTESWPILFRISEEHKEKIDSIIREKISNIHLKRSAEDYLKILKPISIAIDRLQKTDATIADGVEQFKILENYFEETNLTLHQVQKFKNRYNMCITPYHLLAFLIDPTKTQSLTYTEKNIALQTAKELYPDSGLLPLIIKFLAKSEPFNDIMFQDDILKSVKPIDWWKSQRNADIIEKELPIITQLLCAAASSASVERIFSTFGLVHSKLRNRLGTEKAAKLVFLYKYYN